MIEIKKTICPDSSKNNPLIPFDIHYNYLFNI